MIIPPGKLYLGKQFVDDYRSFIDTDLEKVLSESTRSLSNYNKLKSNSIRVKNCFDQVEQISIEGVESCTQGLAVRSHKFGDEYVLVLHFEDIRFFFEKDNERYVYLHWTQGNY